MIALETPKRICSTIVTHVDEVKKRGGLIRFLKKPGEFLKKGDAFAEIYDLYGDVLERIECPMDGYI